MDELGFQIIYIDDRGYLYFDTIGGFDLGMVPGRKVRIHTRKGPVLCVLGKKPIHLMKAEERSKVPAKHELWIDIGVCESGDEARTLSRLEIPLPTIRTLKSCAVISSCRVQPITRQGLGWWLRRCAELREQRRRAAHRFSPLLPCRKKLGCAVQKPALMG